MRFARACTVAVATAILAGGGAEAQGFGHLLHWRHCGGCYGGGCGGCYGGGCGGWGGCGGCYSGCGGCGGGCRPLFPHLRAVVGHILHHHRCGCGACGGCGGCGGCGSDCGLGGCGGGCYGGDCGGYSSD